MAEPKLHIVSIDVPDPPDYGGVIDIFYKIKALYEQGCKIHLHCFEYGREHSTILEQYCVKIWYYKRRTGLGGISVTTPYIINSRRSKTLLKRLIQFEAPILFEGVQTSYYLDHPSLKKRLKILRTHNIEHQYYCNLFLKERNILKRSFFYMEAVLLKRYEKKLGNVDRFLELSAEDQKHFQDLYPNILHDFLPPFHPFKKEDIPTGYGKFCLYHGNLSHPENIEAVRYLIKDIIPNLGIPFVIAGKNPSVRLINAVNRIPHCTLRANLSQGEMAELIEQAHIHVLPTFQESGMKLKLLYALFNGRHVVVNSKMLHGTGLESICHIANTSKEMCRTIEGLLDKPFSEADKEIRGKHLDDNYNNAKNAGRIITCLQQKFP